MYRHNAGKNSLLLTIAIVVLENVHEETEKRIEKRYSLGTPDRWLGNGYYLL